MNVLYIYLRQLKIHPMNDYSTKLSIDHYNLDLQIEYLEKYLVIQNGMLDLNIEKYQFAKDQRWSSEKNIKELESKVQKRLGKIEGIEEMLRFCKAVKLESSCDV